jgi:hypothetical protein
MALQQKAMEVLFRAGHFRLCHLSNGKSQINHHCDSSDTKWQTACSFVFAESGLCACCGEMAPESIQALYWLHNPWDAIKEK